MAKVSQPAENSPHHQPCGEPSWATVLLQVLGAHQLDASLGTLLRHCWPSVSIWAIQVSEDMVATHNLHKKHCRTCSSGVVGWSYQKVITTSWRTGDAFWFQQICLLPLSPSVPQPKKLKSTQNPKCTDIKWTNTESLLPLGKCCLATMLCCWTQKPLWQSCTDVHRLNVLRPAERGLGIFIYFKYHIWRQQKLSYQFKAKFP